MKLFELLEYKEYNSTFTHNKKEYNLNSIFKIYDSLPTFFLATNQLNWILDYVENIDYKRVNNSDTSYPIIVTIDQVEGWTILDGLHRYIKQKDKNKILVKYINADLLEKFKILKTI